MMFSVGHRITNLKVINYELVAPVNDVVTVRNVSIRGLIRARASGKRCEGVRHH